MWFLEVLFSVAVFLATSNPLLASLLACVVAGLSSVQSAVWLRIKDPWADRGKACFWFYLATAGWKAAASSILHLALFFFVASITGIGLDMDRFVYTMLILMCGFGVATVFGTAGISCALLRRVQVFVIPDIYRLCNGDFGSIGTLARGRRLNQAIFVLAISVFLPVMVLGTFMSIAGVSGGNKNSFALILIWFGLGMIFVGPFAAMPVYHYCSIRVVARTPETCWAGLN